MHVLVAYDVVDDRRRVRLAQRLTELLHRVQKSVFQAR
jgi:CRISPR-associated endonuclease Cas2